MTEAELLGYVLGRVNRRGLKAFHSTDSRADVGRGFPDLVICGPGGVLFAELKSASGQTSAEQDDWLWTLQRGRQWQVVWRPADLDSGAVDQALDQLASLAPRIWSQN